MGQGASRRRWLILLAVLVALVSAGYLLRRPVLTQAAGILVVAASPLEKADAAVILTFHVIDGAGNVRAAARLHQEGWVRQVVLSGPRGGYGIYDTDYSVPLAVSLGIPRSDIVPVPSAVHSIEDEAALVAGIVERKGIRSVYLVTNNFQSRRARAGFAAASGGRIRVLSYPVPIDWFDPRNWWRRREGQKLFVEECLGLR